MNNTLKSAFTLAEVLITLAIIGIIAAMTLPALMNNTKKTENVVALKKAYETLSQSALMLAAEHGNISNAIDSLNIPETFYAPRREFANIFATKMSLSKKCTQNGIAGCPASTNYKSLDQSSLNGVAYSIDALVGSDGITYYFDLNVDASGGNRCSSDRSYPSGTASSPLHETCGTISADINGVNKGPNQYGRDLFVFYLTKKGIYPAGAYPENPASLIECVSFGMGCTAKVLQEGVMNY